MQLTPNQQKGVDTNGVPCMINAGAGSGKTRVIVEKAAHLIEGGMEPSRLLAITFTRKAAGEMLERLFQRIGMKAYKAVICNWHSFALNHVIKPAMKSNHEYLRKLGYTAKEMVILDESESLTLINEAIKNLYSKEEQEFIKENGGGRGVQDFMGFALSFGRGPKSEYLYQSEQLRQNNAPQEKHELLERHITIWRTYYKRMLELNAVDYDHILIHAAQILKQDVTLRTWIQNHFQAVLADEHQDANPIQGELLRYIVGNGSNLTMVGDPKQSIYAFRAADVGQLLNAKNDFPSMQIVELAENFRSSKSIVDVANAIANLMDESQKVGDGQMIASSGIATDLPVAREFRSDTDEVNHTVNEIKELIVSGKYEPQDIAILYRSKVIKEPFEKACLEKGIEYSVVGDKNFLDAKEVKDWCAFLRFAANDKDVMAASRAIDGSKLNSTGIAMRNKLIKDNISVLDYLKHMTTYGTDKSAERKQGFVEFIECHEVIKETLEECGSMSDLAKLHNHELTEIELSNLWCDVLKGVEDALIQIWETLFLPKIKQLALKKFKTEFVTAEVEKEVETRTENVKILTKRLFKFTETHGHLVDCIRELALLIDSGDSEVNGVQFMTEHASKGLEFKRVYVVGCEQEAHFRGTPSDNPHEELRLFYVASTRAERDLIFSYSQRRFVHGNVVRRTPLVFLTSLPTELLTWESFGNGQGSGIYQQEPSTQSLPQYPNNAPDLQMSRSSNPINMLKNGELPTPDLSVETRESRVEGIKL